MGLSAWAYEMALASYKLVESLEHAFADGRRLTEIGVSLTQATLGTWLDG